MAEPTAPTVGVVRWTESDTATDAGAEDVDRMEPASPRHARACGGMLQRTVVAGQDALTSSAEATPSRSTGSPNASWPRWSSASPIARNCEPAPSSPTRVGASIRLRSASASS